MSIRVRKTISNSFVLDEPELRRIHKVLTEQMAQATKDNDVTTTFSFKLRNQMAFEKSSLDDVFSESNGSDHEIHEFGIAIRSKKSEEMVSLEFSKDSNAPISYQINGIDRDWTTITQSIIEERIRNLRRPFIISGFPRFFLQFFAFIILVVSILIPLTILFDRLSNYSPPGAIVVPIKAAYIFLFSTILLDIGIFSYLYFFSPQNFNWGDYVKIYQRHQSIGNAIIIIVILGLIISIFGSIIANYFLTK